MAPRPWPEMKNMTKLRKGDKVRIRSWAKNPGFWDNEGSMFAMRGQVHVVTSTVYNGERFRLDEPHGWTWRREDLTLIKRCDNPMRNDPNHAFKMKRLK